MPRNRMISLRLSEDELERLKRVCRAQGSRNLSEVARFCLHQFLDAPLASTSTLEDRVRELDCRLNEMNRKLMQLTEGAVRGPDLD